jgi:hypothetical protein
MKKNHYLSTLLFALLFSLILGTPSIAQAHEASYGGDDYANSNAKPFHQLVEEAKASYMEENPDLYTRGKDSPWATAHQATSSTKAHPQQQLAPIPTGGAYQRSNPRMMNHKHTTASSTLSMPRHVGKLKPKVSFEPSKRPVTPHHTPWKEMRAFDRGGDLMFY